MGPQNQYFELWPLNMFMKVLIAILFLTACFLFYYGGTMLLLVPGYPGEGYFVSGRLLYGVLPFVMSLGLLVIVGWLCARCNASIGLWKSIANSFLWAAGIVVLFWIGLMILGGIRQR